MGELNGETLKVRWEERGKAVVVSPAGDVDLTASPVLRQALKQVQAGKPPCVVVDLSRVPYMDSSGVATLVEAMQVARKSNAKLVLAAPQDKVRSIFEIAKLDQVFRIEPTLEAAIG